MHVVLIRELTGPIIHIQVHVPVWLTMQNSDDEIITPQLQVTAKPQHYLRTCIGILLATGHPVA